MGLGMWTGILIAGIVFYFFVLPDATSSGMNIGTGLLLGLVLTIYLFTIGIINYIYELKETKSFKERYKHLGSGHIIGNKDKIIRFVEQLLSQEKPDKKIMFEFWFGGDRYYQSMKNLKSNKEKSLK